MSKEKQIEEMARVICANGCEKCTQSLCKDWYSAELLYAVGYRKQSEWISVDDRLPEEDTRVLVYLNIQKTDANIYTFFDTDRILDGKWVRWRGYISHWMPLPEPPKMKGGE